MKLKDVRLQSFRNHTFTVIDCAVKQNVFLGDNGEGKTNILEAISYLCLTKSFYASSDSTAVQIGEAGFAVSGSALSDIDVPYSIEVTYSADTREKRIAVNKCVIANKSSIIGMFPVVVLSPENGAVTLGMPADRRRFIDIVISQSSRAYLEDLMEYRKILRQRNRILVDTKRSQNDPSEMLEPWNENLVRRGSHIIQRRARFIQEFKPFLIDAFEKIAGGTERPSITYESSVEADSYESIENVEALFFDKLGQQYTVEKRIGSSLVGPHKDELVFEINGLSLRGYASQGQHKTFLVALKLAEFFYLQERCKETPLLLLDDVFSELDEPRSQKLLALTDSLGQTFITSTDEKKFLGSVPKAGYPATYFVRQGSVSRAKSATVTN
jgi:DNA replication and repair protein RecF